MSSMKSLEGRGLAEGVAAGKAVVLQHREHEVVRIPLDAGTIDFEVERLREAIADTQRDVAATRSRIGEVFGTEISGIFEAHRLILIDKSFAGAVERLIRDQLVNAEWAVHQVSTDLSERFAQIEDEHLRERGQDLRDVTRYLLRSLGGKENHDVSEVPGDVIVVADELTPAEALRLGRLNVAGFVVEKGGRNSHATIVARALSLPMVGGIKDAPKRFSDTAELLIDGHAGRVVVNPDEPTRSEFASEALRLKQAAERRLAKSGDPANTQDGERVALQSNIEFPEELGDSRRCGAEGIGLYRSEFLYIERSPDLPSEDDHFDTFCRLLDGSPDGPAVVRTFDLGGRKLAQQVMDIDEENPSLGLRGIRLTLARRGIFRLQLRGLLRAAARGDLWVMIPLVSSVDEIHEFRSFLFEVADELEADGIEYKRDLPLGVMIEVPGAALMAREIAREVDFMALGTNDLIQYTLAVDRNNEHVAGLYQPLHPAVLRLIHLVSSAGKEASVPVSLCGEMAASPEYTELLVGLGLRILSMSPRSIPEVKETLAAIDSAAAESLALKCLEAATASQIESLLSRS